MCLDIDKRALFSSAFARNYLHPSTAKANVIPYYHNMNEGLLPLLSALRGKTSLPIHVLFQHPSPTGGKLSREAIALASRDCAAALVDGVADSIHFVYDYNSRGKTCWKDLELRSLCSSKLHKMQKDDVQITEATIIAEADSDIVSHPILGSVPRCGWAKMKRGCEKSFSITKTI